MQLFARDCVRLLRRLGLSKPLTQRRPLYEMFERLEATEVLPGLTVGRLLNIGLCFFFLRVIVAVAAHPQMLYPRYGRTHRIVGMCFFAYLLYGIIDARLTRPTFPRRLAFDAGISVLGFATAFSAARDFGGARSHAVGSEASGILDEKATVSRSEMVEHCFYQLLNLAQILYLYSLAAIGDWPTARIALAVSMTLPWLARSRFPVNSFSANYSRPGVGGTTPLIRFLYRMKKYQYILYKHALLHGLNVSMALGDGTEEPLVGTAHFRLYWLCLNIAYVFEFFMQTLVKRQFMSQGWMLLLQQVLMLVSTAAAVQVLQVVRVLPAMLSLMLNFTRRGREVSNGCVVIAVASLVHFMSGQA